MINKGPCTWFYIPFLTTPDENTTRLLEKCYIRKFKPKLNTKNNPGTTYNKKSNALHERYIYQNKSRKKKKWHRNKGTKKKERNRIHYETTLLPQRLYRLYLPTFNITNVSERKKEITINHKRKKKRNGTIFHTQIPTLHNFLQKYENTTFTITIISANTALDPLGNTGKYYGQSSVNCRKFGNLTLKKWLTLYKEFTTYYLEITPHYTSAIPYGYTNF